jgi:hypothetical protein
MFIQKSLLTLASAAVLFAFANGATMASAYAADQGTQEVAPCYGVNSCKGHSDCKSSSNACKGQNSCFHLGQDMGTAKHCGTRHAQ